MVHLQFISLFFLHDVPDYMTTLSALSLELYVGLTSMDALVIKDSLHAHFEIHHAWKLTIMFLRQR